MFSDPRWRKPLRDLWGSRLRTALVVMAVATGVFAIGAIGGSRRAIREQLSAAYLATRPASITMNVSPFSDDLLRAVGGLRDVAAAEGRASLTVSLQIGPDEWINLELIAADFDAMQMSLFFPEEGRWPPARREVLLERSMMAIPGFAPGETLHIELADGQERDLRLAGLAHDVARFPSQYFNQGYGFITFETLEWLTGSRDYNRLLIRVAERPDDLRHIQQTATTLRERIERDGYTVSTTATPEPGKHWNQDGTEAIMLVLGVVGGFALFLSAFLVINTLSALLKQQTRQIGMMKAIGGRHGQIAALYLVTVIIIGALAFFVALPLGSLGAQALAGFTASAANYDRGRFRPGPEVIAAQAILSVIVPLAAGLVPVLRGTAIPAHRALSDYGIGQPAGPPGILDRLLERLRRLPRPLALSLRNTFRRRARLLLTITTLTLAGSIFISVFSLRQALQLEFQRIFGLFNFDIGIALNEPAHPQRIVREALRVPGVVSAETWGFTYTEHIRPDRSEGATVRLYAVDPATPYIIPAVDAGRWLRPGDGDVVLIAGNTLAGDSAAFRAGSIVTLKIEGREVDFTVIGEMPIVNDPSGDYVGYIPAETYARLTGSGGLANYVVIETAGADLGDQYRIQRALEERFEDSGLIVGLAFPIGQLVGTSTTILNVVIGFMLLMALLLAVVGGLGLTGTMSLNVIERTREIGVMRALGATNRAVWGIVMVEGAIIGLLGAVLGALLAMPVSRALCHFVGAAMVSKPLAYQYSLPGAAMWIALSLGVAVAASYLPARGASRLSVREALAYE